MSDTQPADQVAHPEALAQWRALVGEPDPQAVVWAEGVLGVATEANRRAS
jgi:hypothetical protein